MKATLLILYFSANAFFAGCAFGDDQRFEWYKWLLILLIGAPSILIYVVGGAFIDWIMKYDEIALIRIWYAARFTNFYEGKKMHHEGMKRLESEAKSSPLPFGKWAIKLIEEQVKQPTK